MSGYDDSQAARRRGLLLLLVVILAVLGAADGVYLSLVHVDYELGKPTELAKVCSELAPQGCVVTTGRFGSLLGIPVALWGLGGAAATAVIAAVAWTRRRERHDPWRGTLFVLGAASVLASLVMAAFSSLEGSYCPFCVVWYGINLGIGFAAWLALGEDQDASLGRLTRDGLGRPGLLALAAFCLAFSAGYWFYGTRRAETHAELVMLMRLTVEAKLEEPPVELELTGLPSRGPEDATLTIVEVADFQCPYCRRVWESIHDYTEHTTHSVRVAFVHYPLDGKCNPGMEEVHPNACLAAQAAECARREEKFWEYGDVMFANQWALEREDLLGYAEQLGMDRAGFSACLDDPAVTTEVKRSIARAILLEVDATPTFFVNGYKFKGALPRMGFPIALDEFAKVAKSKRGEVEPGG
jgi:protein-disulfide isomerase